MGKGRGQGSSSAREPDYLEDPWVQTGIEFTEAYKARLIQEILRIFQEVTIQLRNSAGEVQQIVIRTLLILLIGNVKSGKSSFLNTLWSALQGRIVYAHQSFSALTGGNGGVQKTLIHRPYIANNGTRSSWTLADSMGWTPGSTHYRKPTYGDPETEYRGDFQTLVGGYLPDGFPLGVRDFTKHRLYKPNPTFTDKPNVAVIVISAPQVDDPNVLANLNDFRQACVDSGVTAVVIVTHIDLVDKGLAAHARLVYLSTKMRDFVQLVHEKTGFNKNCIFLVKNYFNEHVNKLDVDILALYAFRSILRIAEDQVKSFQR